MISLKHFHNSVFFLFLWIGIGVGCTTQFDNSDVVKRTQVALREVGNELLLANGDTTSRVLPVEVITPTHYQLHFEKKFALDPADLTTGIKTSFKKVQLPEHYLCEVISCTDRTAVYSFLINKDIEKNIVPCGGRLLPTACYIVVVQFQEQAVGGRSVVWFYILVFMVLAFLGVVFYSKYHAYQIERNKADVFTIGRFQFFPNELMLVKQAEEISLTQKECELLAILIANQNQIVKREELVKRVWEDNGVIVGRSLDTYISKLRKKLKGDEAINIANIHGVGYKLEVNEM